MAETIAAATSIGSLPKHTVLQSKNPADLPFLFSNLAKLKEEEKVAATEIVVALTLSKITKASLGAPISLNATTEPNAALDKEANRAAEVTAAQLDRKAIDLDQAAQAARDRAVANALQNARESMAGTNGQPMLIPLNESVNRGTINRDLQAQATAFDTQAARARAAANALRQVAATPPSQRTKFLTLNAKGITATGAQISSGLGIGATAIGVVRSTNAVLDQETAIVKLQLLSGVAPGNVFEGTALVNTDRTAAIDAVAVVQTTALRPDTGSAGLTLADLQRTGYATPTPAVQPGTNLLQADADALVSAIGGIPPQFQSADVVIDEFGSRLVTVLDTSPAAESDVSVSLTTGQSAPAVANPRRNTLKQDGVDP